MAAALPAAAAAAPASASWMLPAATAMGGAFQGFGSASAGAAGAKAQKYAAKKAAKEQKRKTFADLLNEALRREYEAGQMMSNRQQQYSGDRAKGLQTLASQYVQALR